VLQITSSNHKIADNRSRKGFDSEHQLEIPKEAASQSLCRDALTAAVVAHPSSWVWEVSQGPGPVDPFHNDWNYWDAEFQHSVTQPSHYRAVR
jgi:hypothetical protein